jgi:hypothetical protein
MMMSMIPFVAAIVIPAFGFYVYAIGNFLREALRMRRERLACAGIVVAFPGAMEKARAQTQARNSGAVVPFLSSHSQPRQRGAA